MVRFTTVAGLNASANAARSATHVTVSFSMLLLRMTVISNTCRDDSVSPAAAREKTLELECSE